MGKTYDLDDLSDTDESYKTQPEAEDLLGYDNPCNMGMNHISSTVELTNAIINKYPDDDLSNQQKQTGTDRFLL